MTEKKRPVATVAADVPPRQKKSNYPRALASVVEGREKRALGDAFGLSSFGVNLTRLAPGAATALRHAHLVQDEFVYVLEGRPTLITDAGPVDLEPGMCAGFPGGSGDAHHVVNRTDSVVVVLEVGDRRPGDGATYPDDDLVATQEPGPDGKARWVFTRKDGTAYS